ncbi:hypothetical protein GGS20DRAFT_563967 [Poronia punctata]|nr:hypothetical protein GGS20DRAFT_563967 [Poronia punctata]
MSDTDLQWMSGAIPTTGVKSKPPTSTIPLGEQEEIRAYFECVRAGSLGGQLPISGNHMSHTCSHCEDIIIESTDLEESALVLVSDGLEAAVKRANGGCAFFQWALGLLVPSDGSDDEEGSPFQGHTCADISFHLRFNPTWKEGMSMSFAVWVEFVKTNGEFTLEIMQQGHLHACTDQDDIAASYIPSRPPEPEKVSQRNVDFIRASLRNCLNHHPTCSLTSAGKNVTAPECIPPQDLPTRLLRIETRARTIKLVTVDELDDKSRSVISERGYASLSYRWGGPQPLCLTAHTIDGLMQGIPTSTLPRTLRDAIESCLLFLDLDYIWIDALCIKQDDDVDKQLEIARMPLYYGHNTITLSAASAETCTEGFLTSTMPDEAYVAGPFRLSLLTPEGLGSVRLSQSAVAPPEPIASRGWTYQESLLSRRLVIFGSRQVYWTCNAESGSYGGPDAKADSTYNTVDTRLLGTSQNLARILQYPWRDAWVEIVQQFMTRKLGVESDKLLAVAALASRMADEARAQDLRMTYIAGLFVNTQTSVVSWAEQLLWYVDSASESKRPDKYRAPSWSWACIEGAWGSLRALLPLPWDIKKYEFDFQVTKVHVELSHVASPYGSIKSAFLTVQGWMKRVDSRLKGEVRFPAFHCYRLADHERTGADLLLFGDTNEDIELMKKSVMNGQNTEESVYLLELIPPFLPRRSPSVGLILKGGLEEPMKRIGTYVFYADKAEILEEFFDGLAEDCRLI